MARGRSGKIVGNPWYFSKAVNNADAIALMTAEGVSSALGAIYPPGVTAVTAPGHRPMQ